MKFLCENCQNNLTNPKKKFRLHWYGIARLTPAVWLEANASQNEQFDVALLWRLKWGPIPLFLFPIDSQALLERTLPHHNGEVAQRSNPQGPIITWHCSAAAFSISTLQCGFLSLSPRYLCWPRCGTGRKETTKQTVSSARLPGDRRLYCMFRQSSLVSEAQISDASLVLYMTLE